MKKESKYPGYYVVIDDGEVWLEHRGKPLKKCMYGIKVCWQVYDKGIQRTIPAEDIILSAFPNLKRNEYIPALYREYTSKYNGRTKTITIAPGVKLTLIYSYMLEVPPEMDVEQQMKDLFPGKQIIVEEGNEVRRWKEIYFHSDEHIVAVAQKIVDFLKIS